MMKNLILTGVFLATLMTCLTPSVLYAAEISAGATTWYAWWDFKSDGSNNDPEFDPAFLYGPALSAKLNDDFNFTFVFLYGKYDMTDNDGSDSKLSRTDSDLALNYRLNNYFKIFAGGKYMGYNMTDFSHTSYGPGAGISFVIPAGGNFFLLGNVSGLYLWGTEESNDDEDDYNEYGANSSISLAYYIVPASTTISLGGRYQIFQTVYGDTSEFDDTTHKFYGVTLSATYSFDI